MAKDVAASRFQRDFIERTALARKRTGYTQEDMANMLGVKQDTYKQWETRSPLPHRYISVFCMAARISPEWLLTGKGFRNAAE